MTASHVDGQARSLFNINEGADIEIIDSYFAFISNLWQGAVMSAGYQKAIATFRNCSFRNNTSIEGAVFATENESNIRCFGCNFTDNFGISGGVIKVNSDGMFKFYNTTIVRNFALVASVGELFSSLLQSSIDGSNVTSNFGVTKVQILNEILTQRYISESFKVYIENNDQVLSLEPNPSCLKTLLAEISITNSTFADESIIADIIFSKIEIYDSDLTNSVMSNSIDGMIKIRESEALIQNLSMANLTCNDEINNILLLAKSYIQISNLQYALSNCRLIHSTISQLNLNGIISENITLTGKNLLNIQRSHTTDKNSNQVEFITQLKNSRFNNITTDHSNIVFLKDSGMLGVLNTSFSNINSQAIRMGNSIIKTMNKTTFMKNKQCLHLINSRIESLNSSSFQECGENTTNGGALRLIESSSMISQTKFINNTAHSGGSISIECSSGSECTNIFEDLTFTGNEATTKGGAIYYNYKRPQLSNINYENNSAEYGPDIGSYAVRILLEGTNSSQIVLHDIGSSIKYEDGLKLKLVDFDGQIMNLESSYMVTIIENDPNIEVKGINSARFVNGVATFDNIIFAGKTNMKNAMYQLVSRTIDKNIINEALNNSLGQYNNTIDVSFRSCKPGEIETSSKQCEQCIPRTFSLEWNSTKCTKCMNSAFCNGETQIDVEEGYWRLSTNSSTVIECPNIDACLGGYFPENSDSPVKCNTGYKGILCTECDIVDRDKYQLTSDFECQKCPNPALNVLKFIAFCFLALFFLLVLIYTNLRKRKESQVSILLRILTNYLHLISATASFNLNIPSSFTNIFLFVGSFTSPNETFFSFDCFVESSEIKHFAPSNKIFKLFLHIFLPVFMICAIFIIFIGIKCVYHLFSKPREELLGRRNQQISANLFDFKRSLVISLICIIFLFHPILTTKSLSMFLCTEVDKSDYRMTNYMEYKCYSSNHMMWTVIISLPILAIWVIGLPLFALFILIKNRKDLDDWKIKKYFLILYQGFREKTFYWEFVSTFRKFSVLLINAILNNAPATYKIMLVIITLVAIYYLQKKILPFSKKENNEIDLLGINAAIITFYCTIIFTLGDFVHQSFYSLAGIIVFVWNGNFLIKWLYMLCLTLESKNTYYLTFMKFYSRALCKEFLINEKRELDVTKVEIKPKGKKNRMRAYRKSKNKKKGMKKNKACKDLNNGKKYEVLMTKSMNQRSHDTDRSMVINRPFNPKIAKAARINIPS